MVYRISLELIGIGIVAASAPSGNPSLVSGRRMPPAMAMTKRKPIVVVVVADNTIIVSAAVRTHTRKKERSCPFDKGGDAKRKTHKRRVPKQKIWCLFFLTTTTTTTIFSLVAFAQMSNSQMS